MPWPIPSPSFDGSLPTGLPTPPRHPSTDSRPIQVSPAIVLPLLLRSHRDRPELSFGDLIDLLVAEPVVIPLLGSQTIAIAGPTDETDIVVTTAALRQVASLAPGVLTLEYFDPLGYSSFDAIDPS